MNHLGRAAVAAAAAAHASYRDQLRREGRVDAQPGHACHRLQVFADRADVHVTHVPASPTCRRSSSRATGGRPVMAEPTDKSRTDGQDPATLCG